MEDVEVMYGGSRLPNYMSEVPTATRGLDIYEMRRVCAVLRQAFKIKERPLIFHEDMIELFLNSFFGKRWRATIYTGETLASSSRHRSRPMFFIRLTASNPQRIIYVKMELMSQKRRYSHYLRAYLDGARYLMILSCIIACSAALVL